MRITSGKYRGRSLVYPDGPMTHPMGDREKLALFNSLGDLVQGATVLDLFAGSGALGLEALSRGARSVTFVEKHRLAVQAIKTNIENLGVADMTEVVPVAVEKFLCDSLENRGGTTEQVDTIDKYRKYDLILIDPPYEQLENVEGLKKTEYRWPEQSRQTKQFGQKIDFSEVVKLLAPGGRVVLSHPGLIAPAELLPGLELISTRKYAKAHLSMFERRH